jgi:hypothetical protein
VCTFGSGAQLPELEEEDEPQMVELDAMGSFLYHMGEATLNKALLEIEKTLPSKETVRAEKGAPRKATGKKKLSLEGRNCMVKLKKILPALPVAQLKIMYAKAGLKNAPAQKDELVKAIATYCLPAYPYEDPYAAEIAPLPEDILPLPHTFAEEVAGA